MAERKDEQAETPEQNTDETPLEDTVDTDRMELADMAKPDESDTPEQDSAQDTHAATSGDVETANSEIVEAPDEAEPVDSTEIVTTSDTAESIDSATPDSERVPDEQGENTPEDATTETDNTLEHDTAENAGTYGAVSLEDIVGPHIAAQHETDSSDDTVDAERAEHEADTPRMPQDDLGDTEGTGMPSVKTVPAEERSAEYFDDDEEYLNDRVLYEEQDIGLYQQEEGTVSWELVNFRNEAGRQRNRFALKNDPPIMRVESSDGQTAEFVLTQKFAKGMADELDNVYKAYFGIEAKNDKKNTKEKFQSFRAWIQEHPVLSIVIGVVIVMIIIATLI